MIRLLALGSVAWGGAVYLAHCVGRRSAREDHRDRRRYHTTYSSRTAGRDRSATSTATLHARAFLAHGLGLSATAPHKRSVAPRRVAPSTIWLPPPPSLAALAPSQPPPGSGRARFAHCAGFPAGRLTYDDHIPDRPLRRLRRRFRTRTASVVPASTQARFDAPHGAVEPPAPLRHR